MYTAPTEGNQSSDMLPGDEKKSWPIPISLNLKACIKIVKANTAGLT